MKIEMPFLRTSHPVRVTWNAVLLAAILVSSLTVSYVTSFGAGRSNNCYLVCTVLFFMDIAFNLFAVQKRGHLALADRMAGIAHYCRTWLIIDLPAALPLLVFLAHTHMSGRARGLAVIFGAVRLLKLAKVRSLMQELQDALMINPSIMRMVSFVFWFALVCHFMALGWILIGAAEAGRPPIDQYIRSLYWCLTTVATIGYGDYYPSHDSNLQIIYTMVVQVFGVGMYGYIIGNVAGLIANLDVAKAAYLKKMEEINHYMRSHRIPKALQERVRDYYSYLWQTKRSVGSSDTLSDLPPTLAVDISLFINRDIFRKVALFRNADELFIREVTSLLKPELFLPGDYIIREGAHGDCMYFLDEGDAEVLAGSKRVAGLSSGSPFGESALLQNEKRNASVRALTYCHVYRLGKDDFNNLRSKHPEFDVNIRQLTETRVINR